MRNVTFESKTNGRFPTGDQQYVYARVTYKGKTYYWIGNPTGHWRDRRVKPVSAKNGTRVLLSFRDGSKTFWVDRDAIQVIKTYTKPNTIADLREYAKAAREGRTCPVCGGIDCTANGRACYMCGCGRCDGAYGDLCSED